MNSKCVKAALGAGGLSVLENTVLMNYCLHANAERRCSPTRRLTATQTGLSIRSVSNAKASLIQKGMISETGIKGIQVELEALLEAAYTELVPAPRSRGAWISPAKRHRVFERYEYTCLACSATEDLTIDHIVHWSKGGTNNDNNLRVLCRSCNSKRNAGQLAGLDS